MECKLDKCPSRPSTTIIIHFSQYTGITACGGKSLGMTNEFQVSQIRSDKVTHYLDGVYNPTPLSDDNTSLKWTLEWDTRCI